MTQTLVERFPDWIRRLRLAADGAVWNVADEMAAALSASGQEGATPDASEGERIVAENAEAQWGLKNCHILARRALRTEKPEKRAELLGHILRICEQQSAENPATQSGILRSTSQRRCVLPYWGTDPERIEMGPEWHPEVKQEGAEREPEPSVLAEKPDKG